MSDPSSRTEQFTAAFRSKQFVLWTVVFTAMFIPALLTLAALSMPTSLSFVFGILFGDLADRICGHFTDWYAASLEVQNV